MTRCLAVDDRRARFACWIDPSLHSEFHDAGGVPLQENPPFAHPAYHRSRSGRCTVRCRLDLATTSGCCRWAPMDGPPHTPEYARKLHPAPRRYAAFQPGTSGPIRRSRDTLGRMSKSLSGQRLDSFTRQIFEPLGMTDTYLTFRLPSNLDCAAAAESANGDPPNNPAAPPTLLGAGAACPAAIACFSSKCWRTAAAE